MALSVLDQAKKLFAKKKYSEVITLLQPHIFQYKESFDFHLYLGLSFLWTGEISLALDYFSGAEKIRATDPTLLSVQAVIFLRRGDTGNAINYYLQALQYDPVYKPAKEGLDFLRKHNTPEELADFIQSGDILKLYPDPTADHKKNNILIFVFIGIFALTSVILFIPFAAKRIPGSTAKRKDLSELALESTDKRKAVDFQGSFSLDLTKDEVIDAYNKAQKYFQGYRDNKAQYEINRILQSNASSTIKYKARILMEYLEQPDFDSITDSFDYATVLKEPMLYVGCYVVWGGRPSNIITGTYNTLFDLMVGYENKTKLEGIVPVTCHFVTEIDLEKPIEVLGKMELKNGNICLIGISIYQSGKPLRIK